MLFGGLSGTMYGYVLDGALRDISEEQINIATSVVITSRQIASATFIAISSFLYSLSESYSLIFGASMAGIVILLIIISSKHQAKQKKEVIYELN